MVKLMHDRGPATRRLSAAGVPRPPDRSLTVTADGVGPRDSVRGVVLHDDVEVGVEVLFGPPHSEPRAIRLGTDHTLQERDVAAALHKRPRRVIALAGPGERLARPNRPEHERVLGHSSLRL